MFKIQKLSNLAVMKVETNRGEVQRRVVAVAQGRDWLRRWRRGEIGCGGGMEERLEAL